MAVSEPLQSHGSLARSSYIVDWQVLSKIKLPMVVVSVLVLILTILVWRRFFSPLRIIPGPFWASVTRLWYIKIIIDGNQNEQLRDAHDKYGPFVRMAPNEISISHPDGMKKLLLTTLPKGLFYGSSAIPDWRYQTPSKSFGGNVSSGIDEALYWLPQDGRGFSDRRKVSTRDPKEKVHRSKAFASGYAVSNVIKYEEAINHLIEKLSDWMDKYAESEEPMKLDEFLSFTTSDVIGEVLFSKPFGFIEKGQDIDKSLENNAALQKIGTPMSQFKWTQIALGNPLVTMLGLTPTTLLRRTALATLAERQKNPDARFDVVAHWFKYLELHPDRTTFRNIEAQTTTNLGAGSDTVSCALQSAIYHMIRNPNTWTKAREEIRAAQGQGLCTGKVVSFSDARQLPYLQACIKEGLRIHSPVPMGLPRVAPKGGVEIGGHHFPEGTTLSISPWVQHREKNIWGDDADEFNPERWLTVDASRLDKYFVPFGAGYNSCPGQHTARMELSKICSTIIRDYDLKLVDPSKEWRWEAYFTMVPHSWPVYVSKA